MENLKLAYTAGLIDGEGSILLNLDSKNANRVPVVSLTNTSKPMIDFLYTNFGGTVTNQKTYKLHHKKSWIWRLRNKGQVLSFLTQITPYMLDEEKLRRAKHILNNYELVTVRNGKYSAQQLTDKKAFEEEFFHPSTP